MFPIKWYNLSSDRHPLASRYASSFFTWIYWKFYVVWSDDQCSFTTLQLTSNMHRMIYKGCSIKTEKNFEKKIYISKLFSYNRVFEVFTIKCHILCLTPSPCIKYILKSVSAKSLKAVSTAPNATCGDSVGKFWQFFYEKLIMFCRKI